MNAALLDPPSELPQTEGARRRKPSRQPTSAPQPRIDASHLERYCFRAEDEHLQDLQDLLAAVRIADRSNMRHLARQGWSRSLEVQVKVEKPDFWRRPELAGALVDALDYLTGDKWTFKFSKRKRTRSSSQVHLVMPPNQTRVFMPFSNGLDSAAIAHELQAQDSSLELVLVNVKAKEKPTEWSNLGRVNGRPFKTLQVTVFSPDPHHAEPTFRSRPFLFDLLAGYGAGTAQPAYVVIPENGQGSLGGSLVPLGCEAPHRSCHPAFTAKLSKVIALMTGAAVRYEHPALFRTKGQVLKDLYSRSSAPAQAWLAHRSCSYDARHSSQEGRAMHCGACGNCLLRRVSLLWAGVQDSTPYRAQNLHARSLLEAFGEHPPKRLRALEDLALNSVRSMHRMANLADDVSGLRVQAEVAALGRGLSLPHKEVSDKMETFLNQHQTEWYQFLDYCGPNSWVAQLTRV